MTTLPSWSDPGAIASYLTTGISTIVAIIGMFHPGFSEPASVNALVPSVALVVAGAAQAINAITHRSAHARVAAASLHAVTPEVVAAAAGVAKP